ncbi:unnamed protein product, partial [Allacma fusca]
ESCSVILTCCGSSRGIDDSFFFTEKVRAEKAKPNSTVLSTKHLKFAPTRVSVRGKRSLLKSHPSVHYKIAFPSLANEQKPQQPVRGQDMTRMVLNATRQRRQQWKPHVIEEP